jgi:hypothetical protein
MIVFHKILIVDSLSSIPTSFFLLAYGLFWIMLGLLRFAVAAFEFRSFTRALFTVGCLATFLKRSGLHRVKFKYV